MPEDYTGNKARLGTSALSPEFSSYQLLGIVIASSWRAVKYFRELRNNYLRGSCVPDDIISKRTSVTGIPLCAYTSKGASNVPCNRPFSHLARGRATWYPRNAELLLTLRGFSRASLSTWHRLRARGNDGATTKMAGKDSRCAFREFPLLLSLPLINCWSVNIAMQR